MATRDLPIGLEGTATVTVSPEHTAQALGSGHVAVFSTPRLVALLEQAAVHALAGRLAPGETTVGIRIEVAHLAATPVGFQVRAQATLHAVEGRKLKFEVVAFDEREKIGEGAHERMIVDEKKFLERVNQKIPNG